jgi:cell wall assembly regulator SMI1
VTSSDLSELWQRFETWLAAHAPGDHAALNAGASAADVRRLEEELEFPLHPDLRRLLSRHDGVAVRRASTEPGGFLLNYFLLDTAGILKNQLILAEMEQRAIDEGDGEAVSGVIAHHMWVPFAGSFSGDMLFVDHRPGPQFGEIGETNFGAPAYSVLWPSQEAMVRELCDGVESGSPVTALHMVAFVHEARMLQWTVSERT